MNAFALNVALSCRTITGPPIRVVLIWFRHDLLHLRTAREDGVLPHFWTVHGPFDALRTILATGSFRILIIYVEPVETTIIISFQVECVGINEETNIQKKRNKKKQKLFYW